MRPGKTNYRELKVLVLVFAVMAVAIIAMENLFPAPQNNSPTKPDQLTISQLSNLVRKKQILKADWQQSTITGQYVPTPGVASQRFETVVPDINSAGSTTLQQELNQYGTPWSIDQPPMSNSFLGLIAVVAAIALIYFLVVLQRPRPPKPDPGRHAQKTDKDLLARFKSGDVGYPEYVLRNMDKFFTKEEQTELRKIAASQGLELETLLKEMQTKSGTSPADLDKLLNTLRTLKGRKVVDHCCLCGKSKDQAKKLIVGLDGAVCSDCIDLCNDILHNEPQPPKPEVDEPSDA